MINSLKGLIISSRPRQSLKNGLVLIPLFFSINLWWETAGLSGTAILVGRAISAFLIFTCISVAIYLINDLRDADQDRVHSIKKNRPIAAGIIGPIPVLATSVILITLGLISSFLISVPLAITAIAYIIINILYTFILKKIVILDVLCISCGFILRAVAGTFAIDGTNLTRGIDPLLGTTNFATIHLNISPWLYVVTGLGALFIALIKRRGELTKISSSLAKQRPILREYTTLLLDQLIAIVAAATLVSYTLYTFSSGLTINENIPENNSMMLTIPFVAFGLFRYLYLLYTRDLGEAPEDVLLKDIPLCINIILWLVTSVLVLTIN